MQRKTLRRGVLQTSMSEHIGSFICVKYDNTEVLDVYSADPPAVNVSIKRPNPTHQYLN